MSFCGTKIEANFGIPFWTLLRKRNKHGTQVRGTKIEANSRNSVQNHSAEEKTTRNSVPWNKNRRILTECHSAEEKTSQNKMRQDSRRQASAMRRMNDCMIVLYSHRDLCMIVKNNEYLKEWQNATKPVNYGSRKFLTYCQKTRLKRYEPQSTLLVDMK